MSAIFGAAHRRNMGGFVPTDIAGCQLWLAANNIVGLSNSDPVATWADESGNGNDVTQASSGQRPIYETSVLNGLPVVSFDGVNDTLECAAFSITSPYTFFIVPKQNNSSNLVPISGGGTTYVYNGDGRLGGGASIGPNATMTQWNILCYMVNTYPADCKIYLNGTLAATGVTNAGSFTDLLIGSLFGAFWFNGSFAEIIFYDTELGATDRQAVEVYLASKYAL